MRKHSIASIIVISLLLIPSSYFLTPRAYAAVTITASSSQWYGPGFLRILITDTSQNAVGDQINPHIDVKRGSNILASADPSINTLTTAGTFELYLTTSNGSPNFLPANPSNPTTYDIGRINSHPHNILGGNRDFNLT